MVGDANNIDILSFKEPIETTGGYTMHPIAVTIYHAHMLYTFRDATNGYTDYRLSIDEVTTKLEMDTTLTRLEYVYMIYPINTRIRTRGIEGVVYSVRVGRSNHISYTVKFIVDNRHLEITVNHHEITYSSKKMIKVSGTIRPMVEKEVDVDAEKPRPSKYVRYIIEHGTTVSIMNDMTGIVVSISIYDNITRYDIMYNVNGEFKTVTIDDVILMMYNELEKPNIDDNDDAEVISTVLEVPTREILYLGKKSRIEKVVLDSRHTVSYGLMCNSTGERDTIPHWQISSLDDDILVLIYCGVETDKVSK